MDNVKEEAGAVDLPLGKVGARVARWWQQLKLETPQAKPTLEVIEKLVWPVWQVARYLPVIPLVVVALVVVPLLKAASVLESRGKVGRWLSWLFYGPSLVLLSVAYIAGWLFTGWFLWRFATSVEIRNGVGTIIKFFAGLAIMGGTIPLANSLSWRIQGRLEIWGVPERVAGIVTRIALYLFVFIFWIVLACCGILISTS